MLRFFNYQVISQIAYWLANCYNSTEFALLAPEIL